jgi:MOSC domain-containing protein YiiM
MQLHQFYISAGHNYFGHHGKPAGTHPAVAVEELECVAGRGLRGDRFFDYKDDYKGQITFFSREVFDALRAHVGGSDLSPAVLRRNVIVSGVDLETLFDAEFEVQGVRFAGAGECRPCYWMDQAVGPGAEEFLQGRGGLRARILSSGTLRLATVAGAV